MSMLIIAMLIKDDNGVKTTSLLVSKKFTRQEPTARVWDVLQEAEEVAKVAGVKIIPGAGLKNSISYHIFLTVSPQNTIIECWFT